VHSVFLVQWPFVLPFRESSRWKATTLLKERLNRALGKNHGTLDKVFQFSRSPAHPQLTNAFMVSAGCSRSSVSCGEQLLHEMPHEQGDIFFAIPQGWHSIGKNMQTVKYGHCGTAVGYSPRQSRGSWLRSRRASTWVTWVLPAARTPDL